MFFSYVGNGFRCVYHRCRQVFFVSLSFSLKIDMHFIAWVHYSFLNQMMLKAILNAHPNPMTSHSEVKETKE